MPQGNRGRQSVGPLNFDALFKSKLDATLDVSRLAIVDTPSRNYLVEFLPAQIRSISSKQNAGGSTSNPINELTHLLNTGSSQWSKWTQSGMNELERFLNISNSKMSSFKPSLNLEAQLVGSPLAAPIPEPSTWLVFTELIAGATALKFVAKKIKERDGHRRKKDKAMSCLANPTILRATRRYHLSAGRHASFRPAGADQRVEPRHRYGAGAAGHLGAMETVR